VDTLRRTGDLRPRAERLRRGEIIEGSATRCIPAAIPARRCCSRCCRRARRPVRARPSPPRRRHRRSARRLRARRPRPRSPAERLGADAVRVGHDRLDRHAIGNTANAIIRPRAKYVGETPVA
jgi:hypothetical protein